MRLEDLARGPCGRLTKAPLIKGGHHAFSTDPILIAEWQARFPHALWGLRCGEHFDVLDLDGPDGQKWLDGHERGLPATRIQVTPHGKHYYFLPDKRLRRSISKIAKGVDVLPTGQVIAWWLEGLPVIDDPIARWPEWLVALAMEQGCSLRVVNGIKSTQRVHPAPFEPTINLSRRCQQILRVVEQAQPGTRNDRLYWAACRFGEIITEGRLRPKVAEQLLKSAAQICGLVRDDGDRAVTATILSGLRRGSHG